MAFWEETIIHESNLLKILEDRDKSLKAALELRDREWLNSLQHCKDNLRLNTQEMINNITLMETLSKGQCELTDPRLGNEDSLREKESVITTYQNIILHTLYHSASR